jgi:HSP20 family molecular chaperone IbpA
MQTSNSNPSAGPSAAGQVISGLIILAFGVLIGFLITRYVWRGHSWEQAGNNMGSTNYVAANSLPAINQGAIAGADQWSSLDQMRNMQAQIDQVFQRSLANFRMNPQVNVFQEKQGYPLSMDVRDMTNEYQVRAFLPDTKAQDVNVKLDGNELKVDVTDKSIQKQQAKNGESTTTEWGQYEEEVPLAGSLKANQMKVERMPHELIITVPKV